MKIAALVTGILLAAAPAGAAGIDSRIYTCTALHALITTNGFVFISQPVFGDFAVSSAYFCGGGDKIQTRSVPTSDTPDCPINYCEAYTSGKDN
jgi:hypothetical protein